MLHKSRNRSDRTGGGSYNNSRPKRTSRGGSDSDTQNDDRRTQPTGSTGGYRRTQQSGGYGASRGDSRDRGDRPQRSSYDRGDRGPSDTSDRGDRFERSPRSSDSYDRPQRSPRSDSYSDSGDRRGGFSRGGGRNSRGGGNSRGGRSGGNGGGRNSRHKMSSPHWTKYVQKAEPVAEQTINDEVITFAEFALHNDIKEKIERKGFTHATPIQHKSIPHILEGKDILGLAQTGTGKTGAFLIPMIHHALEAKANGDFYEAIIIAPTRELAIQIEEELFSLKTKEMNLYSVACVGGTDVRKQIRNLKKPHNFYIGTPGRLLDLIENGHIKLANANAIVLDEVDRMLDMGFVDDINFIIGKLPKERQTLFFSATLPQSMNILTNEYLNDPVRIEITPQTSSKNVEQQVIKVRRRDERLDELLKLLDQEECERVMVFTQMKVTADRLSRDLRDNGVSVDSIHGDKSLGQRRRALDGFKAGKIKVLVATDVAARGIDVKDITHVINFDEPDSYETYVHRIGRTGRAGSTGNAVTFVIG